MIEVVLYSPEHRDLWNDFVKASKNGTFLFQRDYMDYHSDRFMDFSAIALLGQSPIALFPANRTDARLVSHGGLSYGGMISNKSMTTTRALDVFSAWIEFCKASGIREIIYKTIPSIYHRGPADEDKYALFRMGAALFRRDVLSVYDSLNPMSIQERRKRGVAKALKHGMAVAESDDIKTFWQILEANLATKYGVRPVHTLPEIELLRHRFPENIKLFSVGRSGQMCAGAILYYAAATIHIQYIAGNDEGKTSGALDLLCTTLIQSSSHSFRFFDFGISNENEGQHLNQGLVDFKEGFGARAICQDFYRLAI
jgi:Acetyltransferase (GNAT) domain